MLLSGLIAFLWSNLYYQINLKQYNDHKIAQIAENIVSFYQSHPEVNLDSYLKNTANLGFQMVLIDDQKKITYYGKTFRHQNLSQQKIDQVLHGQTYHGILQFPKQAFVTGFFDDESRNTIGVPIHMNKKHYALFLRPNIEYQFKEMRVFFAILVAFTIGLSILFVFVGTYFVVKPIRILTNATSKIAQGKYNIRLQVDRNDEIGQLARHFTQMTHSLQQLDEMRQEFVSNVSHEIQSPLTSIQGFAKTLQTSDLETEEQQHYLSIIEKESRRLSTLSKQLLTMASLDKEIQELNRTSFNLADQIKQVIWMTEWQWREKDIAIDMDLPSVTIQADSKLLYQVWVNFITNSIKFTEPGGTIAISVKNTNKKEVSVLIEDTGIGIPETEISAIFDRFYKVDKARKRENEGSGLGLSIAKKIIELHQGSIEVISEMGKGTTFIVRLPHL
jgi:signal transduction histidine kinase